MRNSKISPEYERGYNDGKAFYVKEIKKMLNHKLLSIKKLKMQARKTTGSYLHDKCYDECSELVKK